MDLRLLVQPVLLQETAGPLGIGRRRDQVVLRLGNAGENLLGLVGLVVQAQPPDAVLQGAHRVGRIIDGKGRGKADGIGELPQEPDENRVERAHVDAPGLPVPHHLRDALLHLPGRLFRKGQGKDPGRIRPPVDHICYPGCQYAGLAGPRSRHDQHRPLQAFHRFPLLTVQILKNLRAHTSSKFCTKIAKKCVNSRVFTEIHK